jgi:large subunit ribosomal protein L18Ae
MYREYRNTSINAAVDTMYMDMAGRHRSRNKSIQIIGTAAVPANKTKRFGVTQFHNSKLKFPLPHRVQRAPMKKLRPTFLAARPSTHFQ